MSNTRTPRSEIDIGGSVDATAHVLVGDSNLQFGADPASSSAWQTLLDAPPLMLALNRYCAQRAGKEASLPGASNSPALGSSIRIGGGVRGKNVTIGTGNVQLLEADLAALLGRLSLRERVELLRRFAPTDELLETAEQLALLPGTYESFERNVSPQRAELNPVAWRRRLAALERVVGVFEANSRACGTCFLVGPDLVLTNYHVVKPFLNQTNGSKCLAVRFDFTESGDPITASEPYAVARDSWCLEYSPYSESDAAGVVPLQQHELDFALIRLAVPAGDDTSSGARRGWLSLSEIRSPLPGDPLLLLQYPRGQRLKLSFGKVLAFEGGATRLRYDTNTDAGSSGAPCLNEHLELVAMHHMGDPNFSVNHMPAFNQGIAMPSIVERLKNNGIDLPPC